MKLDLLYEIDVPGPWGPKPHPYAQREPEQRAYREVVSTESAAPVSHAVDGAMHRVALATVTGRVVTGLVGRGDQRGRQIGFPTANLALAPDDSRVRDGVYAGTFTAEGVFEHPAAVSVGRRPTIYVDGVRLLEAHLMDFSGDLYGRLASVRLVEFLRPQHRFDDLPSLIRQLGRDVAKARSILGLT